MTDPANNEVKFTSRKVEWDMLKKRLYFIGHFDNSQQEKIVEFEGLSSRFELRTYLTGTASALLEIFPDGVVRREGDRISVELWEASHD